MVAIDVNSDLGESFGVWTLGDDGAMLEVVTSANVACGFHAGDPSVLRSTCELAVRHDVAIGAQVSYPDLMGFGRRHLDMATHELRDAVLYQLGALDAFAQVAGSEICYVKPHGALYHVAATNPAAAVAIVEAAAEYDPSLAILGLPGSELLTAADAAGLDVIAEAFADRAYRPDGGLVSRREPGSVLTDPDAVAARAVRIAVDNEVVAADGSVISLRAQSICVHGDTPGAVDIARAVRSALDQAGVGVYRFANDRR
ncbi:MAG: 5-oxoprolinase subunit PxpA [Ilumatobacteraceae bacterium]